MRIGFMDSDGNKTMLEASIFSRETANDDKATPVVWIITDDAGDTYFSKDPELIKDYNDIFDELLKNGYVDLSKYEIYCDIGLDEDGDEGDGEDDSPWWE